jgi:uncharacterized protein YecE (DUF72 family)
MFKEETPEPLNAGSPIHIGTSGYVFPDWRGVFYPPKLAQNRWLEYYAARFDSIEINVTYYRLPPRTTFESMAARTPDGYPFWVKVPGEVTHGAGDPEPVLRQFFEAVQPLEAVGKLAGALAQFPQSFHPGREAEDRLKRIRDAAGERLVAIEFRRKDWGGELRLELLKELSFVNVIPDLPRLKDLPEADLVRTGEVTYVRLHGRNELTWYDQSRGDRYDYDYSNEELEKWASNLLMMERGAGTFVFFNNCHFGQAVKNAQMLRDLLKNRL